MPPLDVKERGHPIDQRCEAALLGQTAHVLQPLLLVEALDAQDCTQGRPPTKPVEGRATATRGRRPTGKGLVYDNC